MGILIFLAIMFLLLVGGAIGVYNCFKTIPTAIAVLKGFIVVAAIVLLLFIVLTSLYIRAAFATYIYNLIHLTNIPVDSWFYLGGS